MMWLAWVYPFFTRPGIAAYRRSLSVSQKRSVHAEPRQRRIEGPGTTTSGISRTRTMLNANSSTASGVLCPTGGCHHGRVLAVFSWPIRTRIWRSARLLNYTWQPLNERTQLTSGATATSVPGENGGPNSKKRLDDASLILLLVSHNFIASDSCYDEMNRAMQRHESGQARVIPVILSPCEWENTPMARLQALPKGGRPVTSWPNTVDAFADIVKGVRQAI